MTDIPKKAAIYARVSTEKQELDNQILQLTQYIERSNWQLVKTYSETISGKTTSRPAFDEMFEDARKRFFDVVVFWSLDRFSRAGTLHTLQKLNELNSLGVDYVSYQERYIDSLGPFKDVVISIFSTLAKLEREKISQRTIAGLERAKKEGRVGGRPGISNFQKRKIRELRENGLSIREIARQMNISHTTVRNYCKEKGWCKNE
jgi:DNA invertase Pin-like site-specific DNA recombinase